MEVTMEPYYTVYQGGIGEIVMKKSRFIATVSPAGLKSKHWSLLKA